ncbi:hypothetical protein EDC19_1380 [Natranaerovirga hydrolytica]|uniref:DUF4829 domain-containing protein n=1 Tax=Natranaerovirga hydrolytica TaxID=680378 RepID=A0A4V6NFD4_9FIRM|nr:hypothetical protein [Natranaerovirga hydrolytica]TCK93191.1 hypothetical protein EDC19_1380 [Natranaerovirga hydrolytica]
MDGLTQLQLDSQFDFIHKGDNVYALIQDEENLMIGDYELVITFEKTDGQWKMSDREMKVEQYN